MTTRPLLAPAQEQAVQLYFGGQHELFTRYLAACRAQFPHDVSAADQALQTADAPALRRIAHSLKSVLLTLGYAELSTQARELEQACLTHLTPAAHDLWRTLRQALLTQVCGD